MSWMVSQKAPHVLSPWYEVPHIQTNDGLYSTAGTFRVSSSQNINDMQHLLSYILNILCF